MPCTKVVFRLRCSFLRSFLKKIQGDNFLSSKQKVCTRVVMLYGYHRFKKNRFCLAQSLKLLPMCFVAGLDKLKYLVLIIGQCLFASTISFSSPTHSWGNHSVGTEVGGGRIRDAGLQHMRHFTVYYESQLCRHTCVRHEISLP